MHRLAVLATVALLGACSGVNPYFDAARPHHRPEGFQNNYVEFKPRSFLDLLRWKWEAARDGLPPAPRAPTPRVAPDLDFIHANAAAGEAMQPALTWLGHAGVLAQLGGINVLTDPHLTQRASPVSFAGPRRALPPGLALDRLPRIDVVLISHNHYDHLDEGSVVGLSRQRGGAPLFIVPLGLKRWFERAGIERVVELDWWQSHRVGSVEIVATPVQHWSGRSYTDRMESLWAGYAVFAPELHLYFAGDTGYSADFADTRKRFAERQRSGGFDIALLPIGAYEPRWFMSAQHVNPAQAVRMHRDLGAKRSLGIHWGTFELSDEALDEPPRALIAAKREQGVGSEFFVVAVGETMRLQRRGADGR